LSRLSNGMVILTDANVGTTFGTASTEDEIYVTATDECHLWEEPNGPVYIRAEQPAAASLGVMLQEILRAARPPASSLDG